MSKYVIRNCNVLYFNPDKTAICNDLNLECPCYCKDRTDCVLKQIYEICKRQKESSCVFAVALFADRILQLLNIQECE